MGFEVRHAPPDPQHESPTASDPGPTRVRQRRPLYEPTWEDLHPIPPKPTGRPLAQRWAETEVREHMRDRDPREIRRARNHQLHDTGTRYSTRHRDNWTHDFWDTMMFGGWSSGGWYDDLRMLRFVVGLIVIVIHALLNLAGGCG